MMAVCSEMTKAKGLKLWSLDQEHPHHLETCYKSTFRGSSIDNESESLRMESSNWCFNNSPVGDLRTLEIKKPKSGLILREVQKLHRSPPCVVHPLWAFHLFSMSLRAGVSVGGSLPSNCLMCKFHPIFLLIVQIPFFRKMSQSSHLWQETQIQTKILMADNIIMSCSQEHLHHTLRSSHYMSLDCGIIFLL